MIFLKLADIIGLGSMRTHEYASNAMGNFSGNSGDQSIVAFRVP